MKTDTCKLLTKCNIATKVDIGAIKNILTTAHNENFLAVLVDFCEKFKALTDESNCLMMNEDEPSGEPCPIRLAVSKLNTKLRLANDNSDAQRAKIMMSRCDKGIAIIVNFKNAFSSASETSQMLANKVIALNQDFRESLGAFL